MFLLKLRQKFSWVLALGLTLLISHPAFALGISTSSITFSQVTLSGEGQTTYGDTSPWRVDSSDASEGWNVTVTASDFFDQDNHTISASNLAIRLLDENITVVSGDAGPVSTQTSYTSLGSGWVKIMASQVGVGIGVYDLDPDFSLYIPADTYAGEYSCTVTVSIVTGP